MNSGVKEAECVKLFDFFKAIKRRIKLAEAQLWNEMWDRWVRGETKSPYTELMTYSSEVNNGGHSQYFTNVDNVGDLKKEMKALKSILPFKFKRCLKRAYKAYLMLENDVDDEWAEDVLEKCDDMFFKNEKEINSILEKYSFRLDSWFVRLHM